MASQPITVDFDDAPPTVEAVNGHESFESARPVNRVGRMPRPAALGRTLPHSLESEECLLASCLLDGPSIIPRCLDAHIGPESFYDPKHGTVYEALLGLHARQASTEIDVLAEELKRTRQLDHVGGFPFLAQISSRVPTTAQASFFIERVRTLSQTRELIRTATQAVENCYAFSGGDISEIAQPLLNRVQQVTSLSPQKERDKRLLTEITARRFDPAVLVPKPEPIYSLAGTPICTPGNLTTIYSQPKVGKSAFIGAMLGATMSTPTAGHDTLSVTGPNYAGHAVLHFDTEQSPYHWQQLVLTSLRRIQAPAPPPWLQSYTLTGLPAPECRALVAKALSDAHAQFGGIHSVILDGIGDLVVDPNDSEECFPLITDLHGQAIRYHTTIISILHLNPGPESKGRGHLGSQLERKSESNLMLEKSDETTIVYSTKQRGKSIGKDKAIAFQWSEEHQMHRSTEAPESNEPKASRNGGRAELYPYSVYANLMPPQSSAGLPLTQLARVLSANKPITAKQLFNVLERWSEDGVVEIVNTPKGRMYRQSI